MSPESIPESGRAETLDPREARLDTLLDSTPLERNAYCVAGICFLIAAILILPARNYLAAAAMLMSSGFAFKTFKILRVYASIKE